jgi:cellulose synthase (UDP-forming)
MRNSLRLFGLIFFLVVIDGVLLAFFNTLIWPYFWPYPALFVLVVGFAILIWFPELGRSIWMLRVVGLLLILIGQSYLIHSIQIVLEQPSVLTIAHCLGYIGTFGVMILNYVNQIKPRNHTVPPPLPAVLPAIAVVVPTYGEPYDVLEKTVVSLKRLDYPPELLHIVVTDDGHRSEVRYLADLHEVYYNPGARKDAKAGNLNSALDYLDKVFPQAELILTQDADEVVHSGLLKKTVGYFSDPAIAFVQTPKEVFAPKNDPFGTRDRMFYDVLQVGRNGAGAAFACGSGVVWRISAIKAIGGFSTWNVVEDLTTSYRLHSAGYRSEYHNEILSIGLAPDDIPGLLKQRGTWAVDTWRLFLFDNPLLKSGLTRGQRLQYLELGFFYLTSTLFLPLLMFTPLVSGIMGDFIPIRATYLLPWVTISILYYIILSRGHGMFMLRMWQYWVGHWPTYTKAFWVAVRSRHKKPKYVVTRKTRTHGFYGYLLWAQFLYLALGVFALLRTLLAMPEVELTTRLTNCGVLLFFMVMMSCICRAAFYSTEPMFRWLPFRNQGFNRQVRKPDQ